MVRKFKQRTTEMFRKEKQKASSTVLYPRPFPPKLNTIKISCEFFLQKNILY